jgi:WD40 repeat protein
MPQTQRVDPARTRVVQELRHNSPLLSCRFDPRGRFIFAGAQDNTIVRWELAGGHKTLLRGHRSWVRGLAFHPTQGKLFSGDYHGRVSRWSCDASDPSPEHTAETHRGWVRMVAVSADGRFLASAGNDHLVKIWSTDDLSPIRVLRGHDCHVYNVAFHPGGQFLVSADLHGNVKQWNMAQGVVTRTLDAGVLHRYDQGFRADIGGVRGMAFNADGSLLACAGITDVTNAFAGVGKPAIVLFDWRTGRRRQLLRPQANFQGTAWGVGFHSSDFVAGVGGGSGGALWFWRPDQERSFHTLNLPTNARDLHLHSDGKRFAIAFADGALRIYDMSVT